MDNRLAAYIAPLQIPSVSVEETTTLFKVRWTTRDMEAGEVQVKDILARAIECGFQVTASSSSPAGAGKETATWSLKRSGVRMVLDIVRNTPDAGDNWCGAYVRLPKRSLG